MRHWTSGPDTEETTERSSTSSKRLLADGGQEQEDDESAEGESEETDDETSGGSSSNVEVMDAGEAKPAEPEWEEPDIQNVEDIPEVEGPKTRPSDWNDADAPTGGKSGGVSDEMPDGIPDDMPGEVSGGPAADDTATSGGSVDDGDPTAGMPNTARSPGQTRLKEGSAEGYVVALELCANLPQDIRLPDEAADLVPVALEAELEQNVEQFAGEQFDNPSPHVDTLDFVEVDSDIWLRLRLGIPPEAFTDLDPEEIQKFALQKLEGML